MVQAIPGGNAEGWLPTTTLKLESRTRSSQELYFENSRPAAARCGDACSTRSAPCTHSASARQVRFAQGATRAADTGGKKPHPELHLPMIGKLSASTGQLIKGCEKLTVDASKGIGNAAIQGGKSASGMVKRDAEYIKRDAAVAWNKIREAAAALHDKSEEAKRSIHAPMSLEEMLSHMKRHSEPLSPEELQARVEPTP